MASLQDAADMAQDDRLIPPLTAAAVKAAVDIINEDSNTENHYERTVLAQQILQDPQGLARRFAWAVTTNTTVVAQWAEDDIDGAVDNLQFVVNSVFNALAGLPA